MHANACCGGVEQSYKQGAGHSVLFRGIECCREGQSVVLLRAGALLLARLLVHDSGVAH
jgi:hypothetical protein